MLAYASHRRPVRHVRPATLLLIVGGHAVMLAAVMAIRADMVDVPTIIRTRIYTPVEPAPPPPPNQSETKHKPSASVSSIDTPKRTVVVPMPDGPLTVELQQPVELGNVIGTGLEGGAARVPQSLPPVITRSPPRLLTSGAMLRPPYPDSKIRSEEEAVLRLRLAIGPDGRVTGVEPVGAADPAFLAAARAHLLRVWRYFPAKEGDRAVATSIVITLRFELSE